MGSQDSIKDRGADTINENEDGNDEIDEIDRSCTLIGQSENDVESDINMEGKFRLFDLFFLLLGNFCITRLTIFFCNLFIVL